MAIGYLLIATLPAGISNFTTSNRGEDMITFEGNDPLQSQDKKPSGVEEVPASPDSSLYEEEQDELTINPPVKFTWYNPLTYGFLILDVVLAMGAYLAAKRYFS
jgi:hypothetical protein